MLELRLGMSRFANLKALQTPAAPVKAIPSSKPVSPPVMVVTPSGSGVDQSWNADEANSFRRLGVFLLLAYAFVRFSFLSEIANHITGYRPFLVQALGLPAAVFMLISGGLRRSFRARPAFYMVGLMFWLLLAIPFSFWRGGSVQLLLPAFETEFSMLFLVAGLLLTLREVNRFLSVLALAGTLVILASFYYGSEDFGRFGFSFGTLQNANDYATHLLLVLPFLVLVALNSSSSFIRFGAAVLALLGTYLVLKTGSRGGLLALVAMLGFFFLKTTMVRRAAIVATVVVMGLILLFALPRTTMQRYLMLVDSSVEQEAASNLDLERAVGSSAARKDLLSNSLTLTAQHPLFGVGPGMFAASDADRAKAQGKQGMWLLTHNSYTEVASESGVPGFLLFVGALVSAYLLVRSVYIRAKVNPRFVAIRNAAFCIMLAILGFSICIFFAAMSYRYYLPSLVGLAVAFTVSARHEMNRNSTGHGMRPRTLPWARGTVQ